MNRQLHHHILYAAVTILWCLLSVAACDSAGRRAAMLAALDEADSLNRNYILITSDSLLREAVDYFDHHGTSNERLRAHYLLGCAYRDMGEAPRAIEAWQDGITCADTTAADCDYKSLGKAYSQMANLFHRQLLLSDETEARTHAYYNTMKSGDTLIAIHEYKMMANSYLLQNMNDSAEIVLKNAMFLYERYGYHQEGLKASLMLMYIYANQSSRLPDLKDLINKFEAECTLFDEYHELPPSKRQYYYYKGRYYENIHQLDSAELCYRKIYRPNMSFADKDPLYRGLLSIFQKKQQSDSVAKYAKLFAEANDSSITLKDKELTAQMAACYNYNQYQRQAIENTKKANQRLYIVVALLTIIVICIIAALFFNLQYRKKKKVLEELQREHEEAKNRLSRIRNQLRQLDEKHKKILNSLQKDNAESHAVIAMLNNQHEVEKEQLILELRSNTERMEQLERQLKISLYSKSSQPFLNLGIVRRVKIYAEGNQRQLNENDMHTLSDAVKDHFPDLITDLDSAPAITPLAKNVCLLTMLNLKPGEIVNLLGISSSQVSNLRKDINTALFNEKTTRTLYQNLSRRYKILSF